LLTNNWIRRKHPRWGKRLRAKTYFLQKTGKKKKKIQRKNMKF
jgi:hypothetical protein